MRGTLFAIVLCVLAAPIDGAADTLGLHIFDSQYTTKVLTRVISRNPDGQLDFWNPTLTTRTTVAVSPVAAALQVAGTDWAVASADLFALDVATNTIDTTFQNVGHAEAEAQMALRFTTQNGLGAIGFDFAGDQQSNFSAGSIGLLDLTTNALIWSYGWTRNFVGSVPWTVNTVNAGPDRYVANMSLSHTFDAAHMYALTVSASTNATDDSQALKVRVSNVQSVPEPSSLLLIGTGLATGAMARRRAKRRSMA